MAFPLPAHAPSCSRHGYGAQVRSLLALAQQDRWDAPSWEQAGLELLNSPNMTEDVRTAFEELLSQFPLAVRHGSVHK